MNLKIGATYLINHARKGTFTAKILSQDSEFAEVEVVKGRAEFISFHNVGKGTVGDQFSVRLSFCTFQEIPEEEKT